MAEPRLKRELSTRDLVVYGIMFMIPVAPFAWYGTYIASSQGMVALAYLIGLVAMLFTGFSYASMSSRYPISGSVYSYVQRATRPELGFLAGWAICLDYIFLPAVAYVIGAMFFTELVPGVPQWAWVVIFALVTTIINVLGIRLMAQVSWGLFFFQVFVMLYFLIAVFVKLGQGALHFNAVSFYNGSAFHLHGVLQATVIVVLSYLGFDAVSTLSEEAHNPRKSIPRGTVYSIVGVGIIFVILCYFAGVAFPNYQKLNSDTAFLDILRAVGGTPLVDLSIVAITVSFGLACALEGQAAVARILFSMGRDGILPKTLAIVHPKWRTPWITTILLGVISVVVALAVGLTLLANLLSFGALIGFMALNASVVWQFFIRAKERSLLTFVKYAVSPLIGLGVCVWIWANMGTAAYKVGGAWLGVGVLYLLYKTQLFRKPAPVLDIDDVLAADSAPVPAMSVAAPAEVAVPPTA
jgi:amino acid transporter